MEVVMYSRKKIPAPFHQPSQKNAPKEKNAGKLPASPVKTKPHKAEILPILTTEEKTPPKKTMPQGTSPLLALAFFELFLSNKEG